MVWQGSRGNRVNELRLNGADEPRQSGDVCHVAKPAALPTLKKLFELVDGEAGVPNDSCHRICVDGVVSRNRQNSAVIIHHNVLAPSHDTESRFFQSADCVKMIDPRELWHD
jgi:hypothetical protein